MSPWRAPRPQICGKFTVMIDKQRCRPVLVRPFFETIFLEPSLNDRLEWKKATLLPTSLEPAENKKGHDRKKQCNNELLWIILPVHAQGIRDLLQICELSTFLYKLPRDCNGDIVENTSSKILWTVLVLSVWLMLCSFHPFQLSLAHCSVFLSFLSYHQWNSISIMSCRAS